MKTKAQPTSKTVFKTAQPQINRPKRVALYARVSTQEQTKGQFPSCDSQIEELEVFAAAQGWAVAEAIKDEGHRAGTLQRPGLTFLRHLVATGQVEAVACTWYNRLIGSRDFYVLDKEFKAHSVAFVTIHDPTDRSTASGRLLESMLVTIKTFENEQIAEKVQTKMRQRAEKGLWNGGRVPFAFNRDFEKKAIVPDPEKAKILEQMFRVYIETRSDFKVCAWLKDRHIPSSTGNPTWVVGAVRGVLTNRIYIGEIEINRKNKDILDVPERESYRVAQAPFEPLIPKDLFELAQAVRNEKAQVSENRVGRPRSYSQTQCGKVFLLQGLMTCGCCGHSMSPWYVHHKADEKRRKECFINYYVCAKQMRGWKACDHKNLILARKSESWIIDRIRDFVESPEIIQDVLQKAVANSAGNLQPQKEVLIQTRAALRENESKTEQMFDMMSAGQANSSLFAMLNERAVQLQSEKERLMREERVLSEALAPLSAELNAKNFQDQMASFAEIIEEMRPDELQRLLRLMIRKIEWMPSGEHSVEYYLPTEGQTKTSPRSTQDWLYTDVLNGCPKHRNCEPLILQIWRDFNGISSQLSSVLTQIP